jgi:hypothetical protein
MYDITQKFTVGPANFKSLGKELKLEVQLGNAMPNELLQVLTQRGQVTHFVRRFQVLMIFYSNSKRKVNNFIVMILDF